jgi:hypothetical protein
MAMGPKGSQKNLNGITKAIGYGQWVLGFITHLYEPNIISSKLLMHLLHLQQF